MPALPELSKFHSFLGLLCKESYVRWEDHPRLSAACPDMRNGREPGWFVQRAGLQNANGLIEPRLAP
jgi:hypothetical protein